MANTAIGTINTIHNPEMVKNQIEEHIQEKKAAAKGRLRRVIRFLFSCDTSNPYNLNPEMQAKLYL